MLSSGSLSAFTSSTETASVARARPVRETREIAGAGQGAASGLTATSPRFLNPGQAAPQPGATLPRGSLLDLSV